MPDVPLGIIDLYNNLPPQPIVGNHWYWCRAHGQSVKVGEKCKASGSKQQCLKTHGVWMYAGGEGQWKCARRRGHSGECSPHPDAPDFWDEADHMVGTTWELEYDHETCIRVGPFMSEREASRLANDEKCPHRSGGIGRPLGMEVET